MVAKRETSGSTQRRRPRRTIASKSRSRARAATATTAKLTTTATAEKEIEYKMIEKKAYCQIGLWCTLDNAVCGFDKFSRGAAALP